MRVRDPQYHGRVERVLVFEVEAWDVNCPQHIVPRFTLEELLERFTVDELIELRTTVGG